MSSVYFSESIEMYLKVLVEMGAGEPTPTPGGGGGGPTPTPWPAPDCAGISAPSCVDPGGTFTVSALGVANATEVRFPTWDSDNGQDDIVWYSGSDQGGGVWSVNIGQSDHPSGSINSHVYLYNPDYNDPNDPEHSPVFCGGASIGVPCTSTAPNCSNVSGPASIALGQSGDYSANFYSPEGSLAGEIFYDNLNRIEYRTLPGNSASFTTTWTPASAGNYEVCCRAWNDAVAECRPPQYNTGDQDDCAGRFSGAGL